MNSTVRTRAWSGSAAVPALALLGILLLDLVQDSREWALIPLAALDEPAHLLTAWLVLAAATSRTGHLAVLPWVLAGAVLLDLDHVPLYLGADVAVSPGGRPVGHSLLTAVVLLVAAGAVRRWRCGGGAGGGGGATVAVRRWRVPLAGLAIGVATQLLRDLSAGPGVPLLRPAPAQDVLLHSLPYAVALTAADRGGDRPAAQRPRSRRTKDRLNRGHPHSAQSDPRR